VSENGIDYYPEFASRFLPHARTLSVWLPPNYGSEPHRRFSVVYMHDGQNLFDADTRLRRGAMGRRRSGPSAKSRERPRRTAHIVGVANTPDRMEEYGPTRAGSGNDDHPSHRYGRFLIEKK